MLGDWYRIGDFYTSEFCKVNFRNDHHDIIIKEIKVLWIESDDTFHVELIPSVIQTKPFLTIFNECYPEQKDNKIPHHKEVIIFSISALNKLKFFFDKINENQRQIPEDLVLEIQNAFFYVNKKGGEKLLASWKGDDVFLAKQSLLNIQIKNLNLRHLIKTYLENKLFFEEKHHSKIPKKNIPKKGECFVNVTIGTYLTFLNPKFKNNTERQQEKKFARLFAQGLNPNALVTNGSDNKNILLFSLMITTWNTEIIKIMLAYGADPRLRITYDDYDYFSPLEFLVWAQGSPLKELADNSFNAIDWASNKPRAPLQSLLTLKSMRTQNFQPWNHSLMTIFEFSNSKVLNSFLFKADFKLPENSSYLSSVLKNLYKLFCKYFKFRDNKSYEAFKKNFGHNKYIDLLYEENHLIGFYFYQMIFNQKKGYFIQYNAYSALKEEYRGYRIATLLAARSAFALQQIFDSLKGGVFFFAVSYNSFCQVEMLNPYPKFLTDDDRFVEEHVLPHFLEPEEKLFRDNGIMRFVEDESACDPTTSNTTDPNKKMLFNEHILGLSKDNENKKDVWVSRSAPVFFATKSSNLRKMSDSIKKINIDFEAHIKELTTFFNKDDFKEEKKPSFLRSKF